MIASLYLLAYLACGVLIVRFLLPRLPVLSRVWVGLSLGLLMMMWLPALLAFPLTFGWAAHLLALLPLAGLTVGAYFLRDKRPVKNWDEAETTLARQMLLVVLPLTVLSGYLQYTHNMRVDQWGNWNVGQSTYGDLPMHLSFITSLKNSAFPPDYPFYPGHRLSYPFLADTLSTSFYLMDWSLQLAIAVPGTLMMALCYMGVMCMAREMTVGKKTVILATLLFFLNGGLGFLYDFDQAGGWEANGTPTFWARIRAILMGFYKTPTNQPDPNNLRWSNVIADLMIPQRTLLGGWCMALPCFYLLYLCFDPGKREQNRLRMTALLGVWGGLLPLIHTHSFVALALCSFGMLVYDMIHDEERLAQFRQYMLYGAIAAVIALPQLFAFTFTQAFQQAGAEGSGVVFMRLWFNWANNPGGTGNLRDFYFWFYIKNIGLPFIALVLALFEREPKNRRLFAGALVIILAAELIRFQPNEYDNNKLLYLAWLLCCMIVANWCKAMWERLKGLRARPVIAVCLAVATFLSAGLTLWREAVSDYLGFSAQAVAAGEFARDHTEEDSLFLTGRQHLNPISSIAGRSIVCGPDLWLYFHGFNAMAREADIAAFYADPEGRADVLAKYDVDYIYVSSYELGSYQVNTAALSNLYEIVFMNGEAAIWKVPEG